MTSRAESSTATVTHISGLHGDGLAAFERAGDIVATGMNEQAESLLRQMRMLLKYANDVFPIDVETADAFGARAANKLAAAIRLQQLAR